MKAIPPGVRPLLLVAVPVLLLHSVFRKTPENAPPPPPAPGLPGAAPAHRTDVPPASEVRRMVEEAEEFQTVKTAVCVKKADIGAMNNEVCRTLMRYGYVAYLVPNDIRLGLTVTDSGRSQLGEDLSEDFREVTVVIGRRKFEGMVRVATPGQDEDSREHNATRVTFSWRWEAANRLGRSSEFAEILHTMTGEAYFQRGANNLWQLTEVKFRDSSPPYDWRP